MRATGARKAKELETREKKARLLEALKETRGIVTTAIKAADVPHSTYYSWRNNDKAFKEKLEEVDDLQFCHVEGKLLEAIERGDITAIIFYLKTKGRNRGYGESTARDTAIINVNVVEV